MFEAQAHSSRLVAAFRMIEVIYYATARSVRRTHPNAVVALAVNIFQTMMLVAIFYIMFTILGMRSAAIRGDFLIYIMSGIFLFMTNTKTMSAIAKSDGPSSAMMLHAPMNTLVSIISTALGALYVQVLSVVIVLTVYHVAFSPVEIYQPAASFAMILLAWFNGCSVGIVFLALTPWFPQFTGIATNVYTRANMLASGKMFLANALPYYMIMFFSWNPLFHIIDQARGFAFINYNPHYSNWLYPLIVSIVFIMLGLMGESYTRKHASASWGARR